jgi:hypothetical protein
MARTVVGRAARFACISLADGDAGDREFWRVVLFHTIIIQDSVEAADKVPAVKSRPVE